MRFHTVHKVLQSAEEELLKVGTQENYDDFIKKQMSESVARVIFEKSNIPIVRTKHPNIHQLLRKDEEPYIEYETEFIMLSRMEYEEIVLALNTIKSKL